MASSHQSLVRTMHRYSIGAVTLIVLSLSVLAHADPLAYMFTGADQWGTIDLATGVFSQLGSTGVLLSGVGRFGSNVYGGDIFGHTLYQVNQTNGSLSTIGTGAITYGDFGSAATGLYAYGRDSNLYSINAATGAATLIGATGIAIPHVIGMSSGPGGLYVAANYGSGSLLYQLNTTTGAGTLIGNTGVTNIGGMVWVGGVLYAGTSSGDISIWKLDTTTGLGSFVADTSGGNAGVWGMVPVSSTPEPSSLLLLSTALAAVFGATRRRF